MTISRTSLTISLGVGAVLAGLCATSVQAETRTPAEATQHAYEELVNAVAQGKITLTPTPTPSPTLTLTPTATVAPLVTLTASPSALPTPVATTEPCWVVDDQGDVVFVPNDDDTAYIPIPCPPDDLEVVVEQVDTPTVVPTDTSPTSTPAAAQQSVVYITLPAPPAQVIHEIQYVQAPSAAEPEQVTPTAFSTPTLTPTPSPTVVPTSTPTVAPTFTATPLPATATPSPVPTRVPPPVVAVAGVQTQPARSPRPSVPHGPPPAPFSWDRHTPDPRWNHLEDDQDDHGEERADA